MSKEPFSSSLTASQEIFPTSWKKEEENRPSQETAAFKKENPAALMPIAHQEQERQAESLLQSETSTTLLGKNIQPIIQQEPAMSPAPSTSTTRLFSTPLPPPTECPPRLSPSPSFIQSKDHLPKKANHIMITTSPDQTTAQKKDRSKSIRRYHFLGPRSSPDTAANTTKKPTTSDEPVSKMAAKKKAFSKKLKQVFTHNKTKKAT
jgi:hypothetical protein